MTGAVLAGVGPTSPASNASNPGHGDKRLAAMQVQPPVARASPPPGPVAPSTPHGVVVHAPARLHLGFLDPSASLGRGFGSLGLVINGFDTQLQLKRLPQGLPLEAGRLDARAHSGAAQDALPRAVACLEALRQASGCRDALALDLLQVPPAHAGFGSGTQLALALGRAFASLFALPWSTAELARITGRGLRSGVGIAGFDQGGLLLDAGPGAGGGPAPLLARVALPDHWRVLLVMDPRAQGLSGDAEKAALRSLPPLPREAAAALCHQTLMRIWPGALEADFPAFAGGVSEVQRLLGAHFAPAQAGRAFSSAATQTLLQSLAQRSPMAMGQSSWGPTGFAVVADEWALTPGLQAARTAGELDPALVLRTVSVNNEGARVLPLPG